MGVRISITDGPLGIVGRYAPEPIGGLPAIIKDDCGIHITCAVAVPKQFPWYVRFFRFVMRKIKS